MRKTPWIEAETFRWANPPAGYESEYGDDFGFFTVPGNGVKLKVLAAPAMPEEGIYWEHVSVSTKYRCPTWDEMCKIKALFWENEEAVIQIHPPASEYINCHNHCLHLWHPTEENIPLPPSILVGPKEYLK